MAEKLRWYIAQANFGMEALAIENLKKRIKESSLEDKFGRIETPQETNALNKDLFPGYVLVQMIMTDETWHLVKETPKIVTFISSNRSKPMPINPVEAEKILGCPLSDYSATTIPKGANVEIIDGPFSGYKGIVDGVDDEKGLANLTIDMKGRSTPISMEIEKIKQSE